VHNRRTRDWRPGQLITVLADKAEAAGITLGLVDEPAEPDGTCPVSTRPDVGALITAAGPGRLAGIGPPRTPHGPRGVARIDARKPQAPGHSPGEITDRCTMIFGLAITTGPTAP
jgi:hypothetical protein